MALAQTLLFFFFATLALLSALMVILSRNMVHAAMFLIMVFLNTAAIYILQGAEFLGFMLVIIYVGAVAVLFLFVVMMLDLKQKPLQQISRRYWIPALGLTGVLILELAFAIYAWESVPVIPGPDIGGIAAVSAVLYTDYFVVFQLVGAILLVAMVAAILLTLRQRSGVLRQNIGKQQQTTASERLRMVDVPSAHKRLSGRLLPPNQSENS